MPTYYVRLLTYLHFRIDADTPAEALALAGTAETENAEIRADVGGFVQSEDLGHDVSAVDEHDDPTGPALLAERPPVAWLPEEPKP